MTQLTDDLITFEVPEGAVGLDINQYGGGSELNYWVIEEGKQKLIVIDLAPGSWQFICTTREAFDEEGKRKAEAKDQPIPFGFTYDYLRSLLTSKGLDANKNYALLKKG